MIILDSGPPTTPGSLHMKEGGGDPVRKTRVASAGVGGVHEPGVWAGARNRCAPQASRREQPCPHLDRPIMPHAGFPTHRIIHLCKSLSV